MSRPKGRYTVKYMVRKLASPPKNWDTASAAKTPVVPIHMARSTVSGALMMVLCALIAVAGIILKRSDYMILGGLLVVACAMQLFVSKEQNIVYVGDHDFIFTGYKFRYKNIDDK